MKSLHKVLDIIEAVSAAGSVGIRELSSSIGFPPATTHRIASTLVARRFFEQDPVTRKYSLSVRFLELGSMVKDRFNLPSIARPHLEKLMTETRESANLAVQDGDEMIYLDHVRSHHAMLQLFTRVGARVPLHCTGVGKVVLSRMDDEEIEAYLKRTRRTRFTANTKVKKKDVLEEVGHIRALGYAVDDQEMEEGVRCVAAPILDHRGQLAGVASISGAAMRISNERIDQLGKMVSYCTMNISQDLGFNPL